MDSLVRLLAEWPDDPWIRSVGLAAARLRPGPFLEAAVRDGHRALHQGQFLPALLSTWDRPESIPQVERCLSLVERSAPPDEAIRLIGWMAAESLKNRTPSLDALLVDWRRSLAPRLPRLLENARIPDPVRVASVRLRIRQLRSESGGLQEATSLLRRTMPSPVRTALLDELQQWGHPELVPALVAGWDSLAEVDRRERWELLIGRPAWIRGLLTAIERGAIAPSDVTKLQTASLRQHHDPAIREMALRLLPPAEDRTADLLRRFSDAARLPGTAARGRGLFEERCIACHAVRGTGQAVGPDLTSYATKPFDAFLIAVLDPNAAIDPRHAATRVELNDGREWTGVITEASAGRISLLMPGGHSDRKSVV